MKQVLLLTLICCSLYIGSASAQTCTECKDRTVVIFDNDVRIPEPDYASMPADQRIKAYREWTNLFYIAGGIRDFLMRDPAASCLLPVNAAYFTTPDSTGTTVRSGMGHPNLPPASGGITSGNYIIHGVVTASGSNYNLELKLEVAMSGELLKEINIPFTRGFGPISTGYNATSRLVPIYAACIDFEKKKRDEGAPWAIHPTLKVIPAKTKINYMESTDVEFTLTDCDQVPLKNRKIELMAVFGKFFPTALTTDESGKCTAKYTAGIEACTDQVSGRFTYRNPTQAPGFESEENMSAFIEVGNTDDWTVQGDFTFRENVSFEQTIGDATRITSETVRTNLGFFNAVLDMKLLGVGRYSTNDTVSELQKGEIVEAYTKRTLTQASDETGSLFFNEVATRYCSNLLYRVEGQEVNVNIGGNDRHFAFTTHAYPALGGGRSNSLYIYCQDGNCQTITNSEILDCPTDAYEDGIHSYTIHGVGSFDTTYTEVTTPAEGWTITREVNEFFREDGIKFFYQYWVKTNEEHVLDNSRQFTKTVELINLTINSYLFPTNNGHVRAPYCELSQNTPNPFSTETIIRYSLLEPGTIRLSVFDPYGREVNLLENSFREAGDHSVNFNASGLEPGVYLCKLSCNGFSSVRKMLLINPSE